MALKVSDPIQFLGNRVKGNLDDRYGPYNFDTNINTTLQNIINSLKTGLANLLSKGLKVGIIIDNKIVEYTFQGDPSNPTVNDFEHIINPKDLEYSNGTSFLNNNGYVNSDPKLIEISNKIDKLPTGYYYGLANSVSGLPDASELTQKGYAYVASENPSIYYIYLFNGEGSAWEDSGNKFVTTELETDLETKSQTKAPTTKAVQEGLESIDVTSARSSEDDNEFTKVQKYNASANINDRSADVAPITGVVNALGYKVLNPNASFASQVVDANTVYEIRDYFDLSGTEQELTVVTIPANCKLRFEGGMLGGEYVTLQGNNTLIESDSVCIQKGVKIAGTWGNDTIYTKWLEFVSAKDAYLPAAAGTAGVMAPFFEENTYYKFGIDYVKLESEPNDWETNWSDYFKIVDFEYENVEDVAPKFVTNTYYELDNDGIYRKIVNEPSDWSTNYMNYYTNNTGTHVAGVAPKFIAKRYYRNNGEGYQRIYVEPNDWLLNWSNYFIKDGDTYSAPTGIIDNPNPTNNAVVFKQLQYLINGTKGCTVEFEKGYYQASILAQPNGGTKTINDVTYACWKTNIYAPDSWVILNIFELPFVRINLNGSTVMATRHTCPCWDMIKYNGNGYFHISDGVLESFANRFDYPNYVNWDNKIISNYEFVSLLYDCGGTAKIENITAKNSTGDGITVGSAGWYYRGDESPFVTQNGLREYKGNSYEVSHCEVSYCGRNGVVCHSSNAGTLYDINIHHIGSNAGNGIVGSDGIKGQDPRSGIDVEFEDGQGYAPIMNWSDLHIHDCNAAAFGFAEKRLSKMKSFEARNLVIEGSCKTNQINVESGLPAFYNCSFKQAYGDSQFIGRAVYEDCTFDIRKSMMLANNIFKNCTFTDNIYQYTLLTEQPSDWDANYRTYYRKTGTVDYKINKSFNFEENKFYKRTNGTSTTSVLTYDPFLRSDIYDKCECYNCNFVIRHHSSIQNKKFEGCNFQFRDSTFSCYVQGGKFTNCIFEDDRSSGYNVSLRSLNNQNANSTSFTDCEFINIRGAGADTSSRAFASLKKLTFTRCTGYFMLGSNTGNVSIIDCNGLIAIQGAGDSAGITYQVRGLKGNLSYLANVASIEFLNCDLNVPDGDSQLFPTSGVFDGCNIVFGNISQWALTNVFKGLTIKNSVVTIPTTPFSTVANLDSKMTLINCCVNGISENAYPGTPNRCRFNTPLPNNGASTNRPTKHKVGFKYFDSTLNKPIFWNGNAWIDANGDYIVDNSGTLQNRLAITAPIKGQQFKLTREGETDVYLIYGEYGWLNATDRNPWFDDSGTLNAMYDKYNYVLLTEEPSTWATTYKTYYKIVDGVYTKLTTFEAWADDTFYQLDVNTYKGIQIKLTDDDTELYDKVVKWNGTKYINIVDNAALKAGTPTITFGEVEKEVDGEQVSVTQATITSTRSGKIYYTKNGDAPTSVSSEYSNPIDLATGDQVKAICIRDHMDNSNIGYVPVAKPVITFNAGILHIECDTPDAKIYYTTDGNPPSTSSTVYDSSASVTIAKGITVKAFAILIGRVNSGVATQKRS